jgi:hypothetical protein
VKIEQSVSSNSTGQPKTTPTTPISNSSDAAKIAKSNSTNSLQQNNNHSSLPGSDRTALPVDSKLIKNLAAAIDDIDLAYFENGKSQSKTNGSNGNALPSAEPLSDKNKKNKFLNELLKDIYANDAAENKSNSSSKSQANSHENPANKREEDILSEKKCSLLNY